MAAADEKFTLTPWDRRWVTTLYYFRFGLSLAMVLASVVSAVGIGSLLYLATKTAWIGLVSGVWAYAVGIAANRALKDRLRYYIIAEVARLSK